MRLVCHMIQERDISESLFTFSNTAPSFSPPPLDFYIWFCRSTCADARPFQLPFFLSSFVVWSYLVLQHGIHGTALNPLNARIVYLFAIARYLVIMIDWYAKLLRLFLCHPIADFVTVIVKKSTFARKTRRSTQAACGNVFVISELAAR